MSHLCGLGVRGLGALSAMLAISFTMASEPLGQLEHNPFDTPALVAGERNSRGSTERPSWTRRLKGTLVSAGNSLANMDGTLVAVGEIYEGYTLTRVGEGSATFDKDGLKLELQVTGDEDKEDDSR